MSVGGHARLRLRRGELWGSELMRPVGAGGRAGPVEGGSGRHTGGAVLPEAGLLSTRQSGLPSTAESRGLGWGPSRWPAAGGWGWFHFLPHN